jgi:hypothetical protein
MQRNRTKKLGHRGEEENGKPTHEKPECVCVMALVPE